MLIISGLTVYKAMPSTTGRKVSIQPGHAALRRVHRDLPLQAEALANHMGGLIQNLGQVAAALLLNHDRGADNAADPEEERG